MDTTIVAPAIPKLKIGYSMCLQRRSRPFNIICPNGKLVFSQEVKYLNDIADPAIKEKELRKLEVSVHSKLSHLFHADKEVFQVDIEEAKFCIVNEYNSFKLFMNPNKLDRQLKLKKMYEFSNSIINDEPENRVSMSDSSVQTEIKMLGQVSLTPFEDVEPVLLTRIRDFVDSHCLVRGNFQVFPKDGEVSEQLSTNFDDIDPILLKSFRDFIGSHCIVRGDVEVLPKDILGAYKIHTQEAKKEVTAAFTDFLNRSYKHKKLHFQDKDQKLSGYKGIKLKDVKYDRQHLVSHDEETYIFARCVFGPGLTKHFKELFKEYQNWKRNMNKPEEIDDEKKLKKYLKSCPYLLPETVWANKGSGQGYYGLAFPSDISHHRTSSTGCVVERCDMEGGVLDTHESIAKAAVMQLDELGVDMSTSKMSRSIRDKTEIVGPSGNYYFRKKQ